MYKSIYWSNIWVLRACHPSPRSLSFYRKAMTRILYHFYDVLHWKSWHLKSSETQLMPMSDLLPPKDDEVATSSRAQHPSHQVFHPALSARKAAPTPNPNTKFMASASLHASAWGYVNLQTGSSTKFCVRSTDALASAFLRSNISSCCSTTHSAL